MPDPRPLSHHLFYSEYVECQRTPSVGLSVKIMLHRLRYYPSSLFTTHTQGVEGSPKGPLRCKVDSGLPTYCQVVFFQSPRPCSSQRLTFFLQGHSSLTGFSDFSFPLSHLNSGMFFLSSGKLSSAGPSSTETPGLQVLSSAPPFVSEP